MQLLCLAAIVLVAVVNTESANAHALQKRAVPGPASWAAVNEAAVDDAVYQLSNGDELVGSVANILNAADALPRNIPNLLYAIFAAVETAINSEDYYYYGSLSSNLSGLLASLGDLVNAAATNAGATPVANYAKNVINAAQGISCTKLCGTFSSTTYISRLQTDMTSGSKLAIVTDSFFLPQAAIAAFSIHGPTPIAYPTIKLLSDINALVVICMNQNGAGLAAAIQTVLEDADAIGKLL